MERLQKLLARAGVASRRASEDLIRQGRVMVDGRVITQLGAKADPATSVICVDGQPVRQPSEHHYLLLHKPAGFITTRNDEFGRPTVMDLVPEELHTLIFPVGRLDAETTGLLVLTDDGELANGLTHPRHHVSKTYIAEVKGVLTDEELAALRDGVKLEDGVTPPAEVMLTEVGRERTSLRLTIWQGRNRQVRRMCEAVGHPVLRLERVQVGPLKLGQLGVGRHRILSQAEIDELRKAAGQD